MADDDWRFVRVRADEALPGDEALLMTGWYVEVRGRVGGAILTAGPNGGTAVVPFRDVAAVMRDPARQRAAKR